MVKEKDITGKRFGKLIALKKDVSYKKGNQKRCYWIFKCDCGKEKSICKYSVVSGKTKSCGCEQKERASTASKKHGLCKDRLYQCWLDMKHRCYLKSVKGYKNYGGRGIKVCNEWLDKENGSTNFINWALDNGYKDNLTIDRIDVNGNYCPENCRWITKYEQCFNKRTNKFIEINGKKETIGKLCEKFGISRKTYYNHKKLGLSDKDAISLKFDTHRNLISGGKYAV